MLFSDAPTERMRWKTYAGLALVFVCSVFAWRLLPPVGIIGAVVHYLTGIPPVGSLSYALYQLARDRMAYERSLVLQELQNSLQIGATSHMAIVAFDRHVAFCEEYVKSMFQTLALLFQKGPCEEALAGASNLLAIRRQYFLWITPRLEAELEPFEAALRNIGSAAWLVEKVPGSPAHAELVKQMYSKFAEVMGTKLMGSKQWESKEISEEVALYTIIGKLRKVLGVEELTGLRASLVSSASKARPPA